MDYQELPSIGADAGPVDEAVVQDPHLSDVENAEAFRRAFAELASSSKRIAQSLDHLNALAVDTYNELHAARQALVKKG